MGYGRSLSTEIRIVKESVPKPTVNLAPESSVRARTPLQYTLKTSTSDCPSGDLVHLSCDIQGKQ